MVDVGRRAFRATMRLHHDDPERLTPIRWYRVPWDRPTLGVPTFASHSIWDDGIRLPAIGEVRKSLRWWAGAPPLMVPGGEPGRCGTDAQWLDGLASTDPPPPLVLGAGVPACCGGEAEQLDPGIADGVGVDGDMPGGLDVVADLAVGVAMDALVGVGFPADLPVGVALEASPVGFGTPADLPVGVALAPSSVGYGTPADLPVGVALDAVVVFGGSPPGDLPVGVALDAVVATGGIPAPGGDCAAAATLALPFTGGYTIAASATQWLKFPVVAGTTYHVRRSVGAGTPPTTAVETGTCAGLTLQFNINAGGTDCGSFVAPATGFAYVFTTGDFFSSSTFTLEVATGAC